NCGKRPRYSCVSDSDNLLFASDSAVDVSAETKSRCSVSAVEPKTIDHVRNESSILIRLLCYFSHRRIAFAFSLAELWVLPTQCRHGWVDVFADIAFAH